VERNIAEKPVASRFPGSWHSALKGGSLTSSIGASSSGKALTSMSPIFAKFLQFKVGPLRNKKPAANNYELEVYSHLVLV